MRQEGTGKIETYSQKKRPQANGDPEQVARTPLRREPTKGPENKKKEREKRNSSGMKAKQQKPKKGNYGEN